MRIERGCQLTLYHSAGNSTGVDVYLREMDGKMPMPPSTRLSLKGPYCDVVQMLPARFGLQPIARGLWHASVVDPCYWTPLLPARYHVQIEDAAGRLTGAPLEVALRRLHRQGKHLMLDGRRWVFRGASAVGISVSDVAAYHENLLGLVVDQLDPALADAASRRGVPLMVRLDERELADRLRSAARWPAVQLALLPATWSGTRDDLVELAPNVLRLADLTAARGDSIPAWADGALCPADPTRLASLLPSMSRRPVLVCRPGALEWKDSPTPDATQTRQACERLQQELSATFDASGYVV